MVRAMQRAIVIGGGPAGLMAAETLADRGIRATIFDAKATFGRKLLMAGKSGLNLTKNEPFEKFLGHYGIASDWLRPMLSAFSNRDVQSWAETLGQPTFTGSSGRVFPKAMKASPLLRAWLRRLSDKGVTMRSRCDWRGWQNDEAIFATNEGQAPHRADVTVLALGGGSWPRLGATGTWRRILADRGVDIAPFQPANAGVRITWSPQMRKFFGQPVKSCRLSAGNSQTRGEFVISRHGLEGGGVYSVSAALRDGRVLRLDLVPDIDRATVQSRLSRPRAKLSLSNHLRKTLNLGGTRLALLNEFAHPLPKEPADLARMIKSLPIRHDGLAPLEQAISTAGGIRRRAVGMDLMLSTLPGVFVAGEMLDWEAPTGGYLLTACLATGRWAGVGAADYLARSG